MIENTIPIAQISNGNSTPERPQNLSSVTATDTQSIIVASIVLTYEPKRSAHIHATSHTLSPTLSAITAGFLGSSSGILASTLPTRSAPTSAAFV